MAFGVVVEINLDFAAFGEGGADDGDEVLEFGGGIVVFVAGAFVGSLLGWRGRRGIPGSGIATVKPDVGVGADELGIEAGLKIGIGEGFQLGHIAEGNRGFSLNQAGKNGFADPFLVAELDDDGEAFKRGDKACKVESVFLCVMKALGKLEKDCAQGGFFLQRIEGLLEVSGGGLPVWGDFVCEQAVCLDAEVEFALASVVKGKKAVGCRHVVKGRVQFYGVKLRCVPGEKICSF